MKPSIDLQLILQNRPHVTLFWKTQKKSQFAPNLARNNRQNLLISNSRFFPTANCSIFHFNFPLSRVSPAILDLYVFEEVCAISRLCDEFREKIKPDIPISKIWQKGLPKKR
jgi:hypothetical protein